MSTKRPASGGESALAVSAWPLRRKVALALTIPLLLAATLGGLRVRSDLVEASNSSSSAQQVTALRPAVDYLTAAERAMVAAVATDVDGDAELETALGDIREAGRELVQAKESADLTADQAYQVDALLDLSRAIREEGAGTLSPGAWVAQLRQLQSGVTQLITSIVNAQITPEPRLELLAQTLAGRFSLAMQQALVATDRAGSTGSLELFAELGVEGSAIDRLASSLGNEEAVAKLRTANAQRFRTVRTRGTNLGGTGAYTDYDNLIGSLQDGIEEELEAAAGEARADAFLNAVVTLGALLAAILLALLVSRLLLNPIRRVREGALSVAHERLPEAVARIRAGEDPGEIEPIDVTTEEEIGQLARAVDDMHRQAVLLASGEAGLRAQVSEMFVTLSRRNTSLINQQLGLIERLERDEEDPKRLESLFRLDHLAARMRRTADSLLILADAPTITGGVDGLTVSDALQAATSGVQDYQRVKIRSANPMRIDDEAAADVIHLLTELVDNALTYSPPTSQVSVGSTTTAEGVVIEIADAGLGIPAEELAKINQTLSAGGEVTPDTARRMGLFVASRLSQRHGLTTSLRANDEGGTTATVVLPVAVLPDLAPAAPVEVAHRVADVSRPPKQPALDTEKPGRKEKAGRGKEEKRGRKDEKVARKDEKVARKDEKPAELDVKARIDAALGLPTRRPGATMERPTGTEPVTASTASEALAKLAPLRPAGERQVPMADVEAAPEPSNGKPIHPVVEAPGDPVTRPNVLPIRERKPAEPTAENVPVAEKQPGAVAVQEPVEPPVPAPVSSSAPTPAPAPAPVAQSGALDGDWTDTGDEGFDTPIFRSLRSNWLSSGGGDVQPWRTTEIEKGWEMAEEVAETPSEPAVTQSGLPMRRPGTRLVPGGVTEKPVATVRDPEAIRKRLAAHAAGVSRGRAAATTNADPSQMEAGS
jgi:signal transduction histidine kinase